MTEISVSGGQQNSSSTGSPDIEIGDDGELQIYPTGVGAGALVLFTSIDDWRALNAAVETTIAQHEESLSGVIRIDRRTR